MTLAVFVASLTLILIVGLASMRRSRGTREDYYLASRQVSPALVGLSAVATNNSGYMFIGVIGFTYTVGLPAIWLMIGWIVGDLAASLMVHRHLRIEAERRGDATLAGLMAHWNGAKMTQVRRIAAMLTVIFLGSYAAAQLSAGGKALQAVFGWDPRAGAVMVAVMIAGYSLAGGIRASIWTDAVQSGVMLVAMVLLISAGFEAIGGVGATWEAMSAIPGYLDLFPGDLIVPGFSGDILFVVGWLFAGLSAVGQPHIVVRFMALDDPGHLIWARIYYYSFFTVFYGMATLVGLMSRLLLPDLASLDPELALPTMAQNLLHPALVGVVLAGIFAATMSTADSLVLSCSASITNDFASKPAEGRWTIKAATIAVTIFALAIAIMQPSSVFSLVILSWSVLAAAFVPLLLVLATNKQVTQRVAVVMLAVGPVVAIGWRELGWHNSIYEGLPGILAGGLVYWISNAVASRRGPEAAGTATSSRVG